MKKISTILIHDYAGHPFQLDLSRQLSISSKQVFHIYTTSSGGPKAEFKNTNSNLKIINIEHPKVEKGNFFQRALNEYIYGHKLVTLAEKLKPEVIISANTPLLAQKKLLRYAEQKQIPFIFWLQDLLSVAAHTILSNKLGIGGKLIARYFEYLEAMMLRKSDAIVAVTEDFYPFLEKWGVQKEKITIQQNWAPIDEFPVQNKDNFFAKKYGLHEKFVVLYSGTLGMKQNPALIYDTAHIMESENDVIFMVISEGIGAEYLKRRQQKKRLSNLMILPFQPFEDLPAVLASADLLLAILTEDAARFCVPSKVWTGFCAARPNLLVVPEFNQAAKITKKINAGIIVNEQNPKFIKDIIMKLKSNPGYCNEMGNNGRAFAEKNFRIKNIAQKFSNIIETVSLKN